MLNNNYNTNKDGNDIELYCAYDTFMAQDDFEQNFHVLQYSDYSKTACYFYTGFEDMPDIEITVKGLKADMLKYCIDNNLYHYDESELKRLNKPELIEIIIDHFDVSLETMERENQELPSGLDFVTNIDLTFTSVTGYSQGDYANIIYVTDHFENENIARKVFTNLIFDCPIYARFEINGNEYQYYDYIDDTYEWDAEKFAEGVAKDSEASKSELLEMLPEYPDYN